MPLPFFGRVAVALQAAAEGGDQTRPGTRLGLNALMAKCGAGLGTLRPSIAVEKLGALGTLGTPIFGTRGGGVQPNKLFMLVSFVRTWLVSLRAVASRQGGQAFMAVGLVVAGLAVSWQSAILAIAMNTAKAIVQTITISSFSTIFFRDTAGVR